MTLCPLIALLRIRHCPDRYDFGMRYLQWDLQPDVYEQLEPPFFCSDLAELERKQATAAALFRTTLSELCDIAVSQLCAGGYAFLQLLRFTYRQCSNWIISIIKGSSRLITISTDTLLSYQSQTGIVEARTPGDNPGQSKVSDMQDATAWHSVITDATVSRV